MAQTSFVLEKDLQFTDAGFFAREGDIFVFTPPQQLVVYRDGSLKIQMTTSKASIDGLCISGILKRITTPVETPVVLEKMPPPVMDTPPVIESELAQAEAPIIETPAPIIETTISTEAPIIETTTDEEASPEEEDLIAVSADTSVEGTSKHKRAYNKTKK